MDNGAENIGSFILKNPEFHPDGSVFYDVHGYKYLLNDSTKAVTRLIDRPDPSALQDLHSLAGMPDDEISLRRVAAMSGNGVFRRMSRRTDPRELYDIEYQGELMYNMEADADMHYLILDRVNISALNAEGISGELSIRGSFKRIAIINSDITNAKITVISDTNPEIFIVGSDLSESSLRIVGDNGSEYEFDKIRISSELPPMEKLEQLLDYIRSDDDDVLDDNCDGDVFGLEAAACLAVAGFMAAVKAVRSKKAVCVEEVVCEQSKR